MGYNTSNKKKLIKKKSSWGDGVGGVKERSEDQEGIGGNSPGEQRQGKLEAKSRGQEQLVQQEMEGASLGEGLFTSQSTFLHIGCPVHSLWLEPHQVQVCTPSIPLTRICILVQSRYLAPVQPRKTLHPRVSPQGRHGITLFHLMVEKNNKKNQRLRVDH